MSQAWFALLFVVSIVVTQKRRALLIIHPVGFIIGRHRNGISARDKGDAVAVSYLEKS